MPVRDDVQVHRVVVVGAGFAGLAAARTLADQPVQVTLVDQRNHHTFLPLLYEVATAGLDPGDVAYPVRATIGRTGNVRFRMASVTGVDWQARTVALSTPGGTGDSLGFDSLVLASGAVARYFGVEGAQRFSNPLYTLVDARHLRDHLLARLEEADAAEEHRTDGTLTFVVVGGGPTGVEVAGAITELLDVSVARDGYRFRRDQARIVLVDGLDHLLGAFRPVAGRYAAETLTGRGVELLLGRTVRRVAAGQVELDDGSVLSTRTVVWAGGVTAAGTVVSGLGLPTAPDGRVVVGPTLQVPGFDGVYVVGDAAAIPVAPSSADLCPQLAQVAMQSGRHAARQVVAAATGASAVPFRYRDKGIMATVGRRAAIAQLRWGPVVRGTAGWLAWLVLHLLYLLGFRNRVTVLVNWSWRYLEWTSGPRIIVGTSRPERPEGPEQVPDPRPGARDT